MSISVTTKNQGTGAAGASTTRFYFSSNTTIDGTDTMLGTTSVGTLAAGASIVVAGNVMFSAADPEAATRALKAAANGAAAGGHTA